MITDALLNFALTICSGLFGFLPEWTLTPDVNGIVQAHRFLETTNRYAPCTEVIAIVGILGTAFTAMMAFKLVLKIVDWITNALP